MTLALYKFIFTITIGYVMLVEKQKETISGESSDRSQKKKLGK